jgi:hypothetical protein
MVEVAQLEPESASIMEQEPGPSLGQAQELAPVKVRELVPRSMGTGTGTGAGIATWRSTGTGTGTCAFTGSGTGIGALTGTLTGVMFGAAPGV